MRATIVTLAFLLTGAARAEAQIQPDPGGSSPGVAIGEDRASAFRESPVRSASRCLEPREGSHAVPAIEFESWRFRPSGSLEPILAENLDPLGEHRGVPLFTGKLSARPTVDLWVPVCAPSDHYQLYTRPRSGYVPAGS